LVTEPTPFAKLRPGPGRPSVEVEKNQRARLRTALLEQVVAEGYRSVTVRGLARTAGVSTRTLYRIYGNVEDCFAATYDSVVAEAIERATIAVGRRGSGEAALRIGLRELTQAIAENPRQARFVLLDANAAGPRLREGIRARNTDFEALLAEALARIPGWSAAPAGMTRAMVAGVTHAARARMIAEYKAEPLFADRLANWILSLRLPAMPKSPGLPAPMSRSSEGRYPCLPASLAGKAGDERGRILAATARIGAQDGYAALSISRIRSAAGVSRRVFDRNFDSVEDCFLAAVEELVLAAIAESKRLVVGDSWEQRVRSGSFALCAAAARNSALARFAFVDVLEPGLEGLRRRQRAIAMAAAHLRRAAPPDARPGELVGEASVAASWELIETELRAGRGAQLPQMAPTIAHFLTRTGASS
jgi:AcrR family transcriptional regulator